MKDTAGITALAVAVQRFDASLAFHEPALLVRPGRPRGLAHPRRLIQTAMIQLNGP